MSVRLNRDTGYYEAQAPMKSTVWLGGILLTVAVSVATYAVTITRAYGEVKQDIALLRQEMTLRNIATEARLTQLEAGRVAIQALADAVKANTEVLQHLTRDRKEQP